MAITRKSSTGKSSIALLTLFAACAATALTARQASATALYWDATTSTATWDNGVTTDWSTTTNGVTPNSVWTNLYSAQFSSTGIASVSPYTVNVSGAITAMYTGSIGQAVIINKGSYNFDSLNGSGDSLTIGTNNGGAQFSIASGAGSVTFGPNLAVTMWANNSSNFTNSSTTGTLTFENGFQTSNSYGGSYAALTLSASGNTVGNIVVNGPIALASGNSGVELEINGAGTVTFNAANTYGGTLGNNPSTTKVIKGTLALGTGGSIGNAAVTVSGGATLAVTEGTSVYSGHSIGSSFLTLNSASNLNLNDGSNGSFNVGGQGVFNGANLNFSVGNISSSDALDELILGNSASSTGGTNTINITNADGSSLSTGDYTLIDATGGLSAVAFGLGSSSIIVGGNTYTLSLSQSTDTDEILTVTRAPVPEPASIGFLAIGAVGLLKRRRKPAKR